jgi:hypothetical protein
MTKPLDRIAPGANLDGNGWLPESYHHVRHRSLAPDRIDDLTNLVGVGELGTHAPHHTQNVPIPPRPNLRTIW